MKGILLLGNRTATVRDFPDPKPGPGQAVVRMKAAAICGSDLHVYTMKPEEMGALAEIIPGHEPCGVVEEIGHGVQNVKVGDRVVVYHFLSCGHCRHCLGGKMMWCSQSKGYGRQVQGSDADLLLTDERNCLPLPDALTFIDGAFIACIAGTAYMAMKKLHASGRDTIAIFGLGPVGLTGLLIAKALGARVIGVEIVPERLKLAQDFGADEVIDGKEHNVLRTIRELTGGEGVEGAFETTGNTQVRSDLVDSLSRGGKGVFVGGGDPEKAINPAQLIGREATLMGSCVFPIDAYWEISEFMIAHNLPFEQMVTHRFPITDGPEAFRLFDSGKTGKVVFEWA